jgi:nucleotide-binding universal stress UspA family protein
VAEAVDVVLVGAHNRGPIGRLLMGSVSDYVARHAPCPVLIVREPRKSNGEVAAGAA